MPTDSTDGAVPSDAQSSAAGPSSTTDGRTSGPPALIREVQGPTTDRGRIAGLAMVCSAAGVALGFALAGSLFAAMSPPRHVGHVGPAGWSCSGPRSVSSVPAYHVPGHVGDGPRAFLGVQLDPRRNAPATVIGVYAGTPAAQIGLAPGDRIVRIDAEPIETGTELMRLVGARQPGETVAVEAIGKDGRTVSAPSVRLGSLPVARRR